MANDRWKLRKKNGKIYGPVDIGTIRKWIEEKRISAKDYLTGEDKEEWIEAESIPQFQDLFVPAAKAAPPPPGTVQRPSCGNPITAFRKDVIMPNNSPKNDVPVVDESLLRIIKSQEMVDKTIEIFVKNNINEDKTQETLARFIRAVFWGLLPPKYFQLIIQSELKLDSEQAEKIYRDVDSLIFYPHREALDKFYQGKGLKDILGEDLEEVPEKLLEPSEQKQGPEKEFEEKSELTPEEKHPMEYSLRLKSDLKRMYSSKPEDIVMTKSLKCSQCGQVDKVEKVTGIVARGTSTGKYSGPTVGGGVGVSLRGDVGVGGGYAHTTLSGGEQTDLAAELSPPKESMFFWGSGCVCVIVALLGLLSTIGVAVWLFTALGIGRVEAFVLTLIAGAAAIKLFKLGARGSEQHEEEMARWEKSYYCARCDIVFIP